MTLLRAFITLCIAAALGLAACSRSDPERELRAAISDMQAAIEAREMSRFLKHISDDFARQSGGFDRKEITRTLAGVFLSNQKINVVLTIRTVKIDGKQATVVFNALATGGEGLLPERAQGWDFISEWRRDGSDWKVFSAEWK
jgi:ketosteroid isomerase-like protein